MQHKGTQPLASARLTLRRFTLEDVPALYENLLTDSKVTRFMSWETYTDIGAAYAYYGKEIEKYVQNGYYHWVIMLDGAPIGTIGLHAVNDKHMYGELGYCIGSRWWGSGISTEAVALVLGFLFGEVGFNRVAAIHDTQNEASGRVMQKNGMTYEGTLRKHIKRKDGAFGDMRMYGILKSEWEEQNKKS